MTLKKNGFALKIKRFAENYSFSSFVYVACVKILSKLSSQGFAVRES